MKIIKPSVELINYSDPQQHIEAIGRTCYKSENRITEDSNRSFITQLYKSKHWAMLEHFIFIYDVTTALSIGEEYLNIFAPGYNTSSTYVDYDEERVVVSFNATTLNNLYEKYTIERSRKQYLIKHLIDRCIHDYDCYELFGKDRNTYNISDNIYMEDIIPMEINELNTEEQKIHGWQTVKFVCDRGVSHELVRHRIASFAQESTRYCNYSKDKFGNELTFIEPIFFNTESPDDDSYTHYRAWRNSIKELEKTYLKMLEEGAKPQEARSILPNSLKTEIIITATFNEWNHIFGLRVDTPAHPQMREIMIPTYIQFRNKYADPIKNDYLDKLVNYNS